jgi:nucleoside-specific outer membrane channel protein Tsx
MRLKRRSCDTVFRSNVNVYEEENGRNKNRWSNFPHPFMLSMAEWVMELLYKGFQNWIKSTNKQQSNATKISVSKCTNNVLALFIPNLTKIL